jgi:hypothetical protein
MGDNRDEATGLLFGWVFGMMAGGLTVATDPSPAFGIALLAGVLVSAFLYHKH